MADQGRIHIVIDGDASELNKALADVKKTLGNTGNEAKKLDKSISGSMSSIGKSLTSVAGRYLSLAAAIGLVAKTVRSTIEVNKQFERKNSELASILGTTKDGMEQLTTAAKELGRTTEFTSSEVVDLQMALARLGFTQAQILDMEGPVLKFAAAVNAELGRASNFAGAALRGFGLEAKDTEHLLDVMAAATTKSALDFSKLETSMSIVAPVAHAFGLSVEDTVTLLGSLANAGFDASSAATATRNILLNLADSNGKLAKGLGHTANTFPEIIASLKECSAKGIDLNSTLEMTDKRSVAAFNALITGAASADELREALGNVDGTLNDMYKTMTDNLAGAIKQLQSAWEGLLLTMQNSTGPMASVVKRLARGINVLTDLAEGKTLGQARQKQMGEAIIATGQFKTVEDYDNEINRMLYKEGGARGKELQYLEGLRYARMQTYIKEQDAAIESMFADDSNNGGGGGGGSLTDAEKKALKRYKEAYEKAVKQLWKDAKNSEVDAMKEGTAKKLAQIENERVQTLAQIEDDRKEIEKNAKGAGVAVDPEVYKQLEDREKNAEEVAKNKREEVAQETMQNWYDYLISYGNYKERELAITEKYNAQIAQTDDEFLKKTLERQRDAELAQNELNRTKETVGEPEDYSDVNKAKEATEAVYQAQIKVAQAKGDTLEATRLQLELEKKLADLDKRKGGKFYNVFRDTDRMNIVEIQEAIETAEAQIASMSQDANARASDIEAWTNALENLKKAANDFSLPGFLKSLFSSDKDDPTKKASFAERIQAMKDAWANMSSEEKWKNVGGWTSKIGESLGKAAEFMKQIAEASGDERLAEASEELGSLAQNFAAAGGGAATGGWIGAIVGGATDMLAQTLQAFSEAKVAQAENVKYAEDWARALRNVSVEMENLDSPFGDRKLAKAREGMRSAVEATRRYHEEIDALNKKYSEQEIEVFTYFSKGINTFLNPLGWLNKGEFNKEWLAYADAINKGYQGLQRMLVKTVDRSGWANFWGAQDEYTALADLYPELFKNGELVIENAKKLLETNSKLSEEQKKEIQNVIELREAYDEAMKAIDETIESIFGSIAADVTDVIWSSVMKGTDAWEEFQKVGSEAIAEIGKQLIQEMLISEYLESFRDRMRSAYQLGSSAQTQQELRNIVGDIFGGMHQMLDAGTMVAEEYKAWAEAHGFDLTETGETERKAATKASIGATQDSVDESNARLTTIQGHTFELNENVKEMKNQHNQLVVQTAALLEHVQGIHSDTGAMRLAIADLNVAVAAIKSNVGTIVDAGVRVR